MKRLIFSLCLLLAAALPAASQTYEELCERAATAIERDSLDVAEQCIRAALRQDPANGRNALLFANLGTIQRLQGRLQEALESYTYALNFTPRNVPILLDRAALYLELGEADKARIDYSLALDLQPDNLEALRMRAYIYAEEQDYKSARADYEHLLALQPADFNGRLGLAMLCQKEGKLKEALAILDAMVDEKSEGTSLQTAPAHAVVYVARAGIQQDLGNLSMALMDLEEAIRLDASRPEAYLMRGQIYLSQQKKQEARAEFEKAIERGMPAEDLAPLLSQCK